MFIDVESQVILTTRKGELSLDKSFISHFDLRFYTFTQFFTAIKLSPKLVNINIPVDKTFGYRYEFTGFQNWNVSY